MEGVEVHNIQLHTFLTLALDSAMWYASWPSHFALSTDWIRACGCSDTLKIGKYFYLPEIYR